MAILKASDRHIRDDVFEYARASGAKTILDVGGAAAPWSIATHIADIQPGQSFTGDICRPDVWEKVANFSTSWDLIVCTHTLEDIRDPGFVLDQINRLSKAAFIAVPHKHTELGWIDSPAYVGYCHHRWIFAFQYDRLRIAAKWPVTSRFAQGQDPGPQYLGWHDQGRVQVPGKNATEELGVLWQGQLDWEYIRGDFPGQATAGCDGILDMYRDELAAGL